MKRHIKILFAALAAATASVTVAAADAIFVVDAPTPAHGDVRGAVNAPPYPGSASQTFDHSTDGDSAAGLSGTLVANVNQRNHPNSDLPLDDPSGGTEGFQFIGTDPPDPDSDNDTYPDGIEVFGASDPTDPNSTPSIVIASNDIVINEIHYDPDIKTEFVEFVEL